MDARTTTTTVTTLLPAPPSSTLPSTARLPFSARGELSAALIQLLEGRLTTSAGLEPLVDASVERPSVIDDDDVQLALFLLYALSYGSLDQRGAQWEWDPELVRARTRLEGAFEAQVRTRVPVPELPEPSRPAVARALFALAAEPGGPSLARYVAKRATLPQLRELLVHRTVYTLREADPHSWAIPRLTGRAKAALVEIQADEYGGGDPERVHATIFTKTVLGAGLDASYGHYVDNVPALTLAAHNLMSLFGLNRRLRGAVVGHLVAFEMTSSIPNRLYAEGFRRHGFGPEVTDYFDEHVEADAVHEQIAAHDLAGSLAEDEPELLEDIMFGAAACLALDDWVGTRLLEAWRAGKSSLRLPLAAAA